MFEVRIGSKPLTQRLLDQSVVLPSAVWLKLNIGWVLFFTFMGLANIYVLYHFDTNTWVNFKLFGMIGLTTFFVLLQALYMARYIDGDKK